VSQPQSSDSPESTTKPDLLPRTRRTPSALQNKRGSTPSNALATASASHTPPWTASRSATERVRRASRPSPRIVGRPLSRAGRAPCAACLSNCVPATTCSHSAPGPVTLRHTGLSHSCNAKHVRTQSRSGGQRQRIPVGPHAESHAPTGNEISAVTIGSDAADPDAAVLRRPVRPRSCCEPGDPRRHAPSDQPTGRAPAPAPRAPNTVTSPDATGDLRHRLRPWTIRPQPACLRRPTA